MSENKSVKKEISSKIIFSEDYLKIKVEEGEVYRGHLILTSADEQTPIKGSIYSTNDKLATDVSEFEGIKVDIPFYFKGKLTMTGDFVSGDLVLLTNMGEYNVPYCIDVVEAMMDTSLGKTKKLQDFADIYETDRAEANRLFFMSNFCKVFLNEDEMLLHLYKSLQKGRRKAYIVEEFLISAGYKQPAKLSVEQESIVLDENREGIITLTLENDGYFEGSLQSEKETILFESTTFTRDDFVDSKLNIPIHVEKTQFVGKDVIEVITPRQIFRIPVEWRKGIAVKTKQMESRMSLKKSRAQLMHDYLSFRTGNMEQENFTEDALRILQDLILLTDEVEWQLYSIHVFMIQGRMDQAGELLDTIEEDIMENALPLSYNYFLYLRALHTRQEEAIDRAVASIREQYEEADEKAEYLWMLLNLDREYVYNKKLQYESIKSLFDAGCNSSFLYFEACDILNDNPAFMEEVGEFETRVFRWGMRYGYVSMVLAQQFTKSAQKIKFFNKSIFYTALQLYELDHDEKFLTLICALLIKGNLTDEKYHPYFKAGVEKNLKLIGMNEFYIRSMDFDKYEEIPHRVLLHFTYSSSLDTLERAYLYVNLLKNKEKYEELLGIYSDKIRLFVEEQLLRGNVNKQIAYLYRYCLPELLERPELAKAICDIMFQYELQCNNENMIGVYVACPETGKENYYALANGKAKIEIYNERTMLYFVNRYDQRFHTGIDYELTAFIDVTKIPQEWILEQLNHDKIVLMQSVHVDDIEKENLYLAKKIYSDKEYEPWLKEHAIEALLLYYSNRNDLENLRKWLDRTDYFAIRGGFRKKLMSLYLTADMIENAFFGIELYGSQILSPDLRFKIAEFAVDYCEGNKDETTLFLCYDGIGTKHFSEKTLLYLINHFEGETVDYLMLWDRCRKSKLDTDKLEERILCQCIATGTYSEHVARVFENYYIDNKESKLVLDYLRFFAGEEYAKPDVPYSLEKIIGKEILGGRITSQKAKINFLYYYENIEELQEYEQKVIRFIIDGLLKDEVYLPVYHHYSNLVELPVEYKERTFLTYLGEEGLEVTFEYFMENETQVYKKTLEEVIPGRYVCSLYFFQTDRVSYSLMVNGEAVQEEDACHFESFAYEGEMSRFFVLNDISKGGYDLNLVQDYVTRINVVKNYITLL